MAFVRKIKGSLVTQDSSVYVGEETYLFYDIETGCIRRCDGTPGGAPIAAGCFGGGGGAEYIDDLLDVDTTTATPSIGEVLGWDGTNWVPSTPGGSGISGLAVTAINGQSKLTLVDSSRSNKILSIAENNISWNDNRLLNGDWLRIGNANSATAGFISDFDGTVVGATGHCDGVNGNDKSIHIFINNVDSGAIGTFTGSIEDSFTNTTLDIDFNQGDKIRLRAVDGNRGRIEDTVVKLILKWRG